ncbi:MAG: hypothetical protein U1E27_03445, partial [Kiritimatiellia bacterium]|nr:hypothetical protein [Kiritimatiellia bacterium]
MTTTASKPATGAVCPVCSAFVGPARLCPSCGARITHRASLRIFRAAAVLLATAGLGLLWMAARRSEIPVIPI